MHNNRIKFFQTIRKLILEPSRTKNFPINRLVHQQNPTHDSPQSVGRYGKLLKPFIFTSAICGSSFVVATISRYEFSNQKYKPSPWNPRDTSWWNQFKRKWNTSKEGFKIFCTIAAINGLVFLCWRIPRFHPFMTKYFVSRIESKSIPLLPMVLANFSHYSVPHFAMNMIVLYSFCDLSCHLFGRENFLALYISSGMISSFASCFHKTVLNLPNPSLGASGAILGVLGATCFERPDIQLMIIFLPFFTFSSYTALKAILMLDSLGIILRWEFFDHAAHLGGTLTGIYYSSQLKQYLSDKRSFILRNWKNFKSNF